MSLENEVAALRNDVEKLKRRRDLSEESKHRVWNNLQQELLVLCKQTHTELNEFKQETRQRFDRLENNVMTIKQDQTQTNQRIDRLETSVSEVKLDVNNMKSDIGNIKSDISNMKSDITEIKSLLLEKRN